QDPVGQCLRPHLVVAQNDTPVFARGIPHVGKIHALADQLVGKLQLVSPWRGFRARPFLCHGCLLSTVEFNTTSHLRRASPSLLPSPPSWFPGGPISGRLH